jgi:hypothetical protein
MIPLDLGWPHASARAIMTMPCVAMSSLPGSPHPTKSDLRASHNSGYLHEIRTPARRGEPWNRLPKTRLSSDTTCAISSGERVSQPTSPCRPRRRKRVRRIKKIKHGCARPPLTTLFSNSQCVISGLTGAAATNTNGSSPSSICGKVRPLRGAAGLRPPTVSRSPRRASRSGPNARPKLGTTRSAHRRRIRRRHVAPLPECRRS